MPSALPTKTILVAFRDVGGGDGGWPYEDYLGNFLPDLLIYTDGQMLKRLGAWYWEVQLTPSAMCTLLQRIQATGFMQLQDQDDIYEPGIVETIGDGAPTYSIYVNGDPAVSVYVSIMGMAHVIPQVAEMRSLLMYYSAPGSYTPYVSEAAVVWVERGRGVERWQPTYYGPTPEPTPAIDSWPADLPPLASMLPNKSYDPPYFQGILAQRLSGLPKRFGIYSNFGQEFLVIVRPMLPHERTPNAIYYYSTPAPLELPFTCN